MLRRYLPLLPLVAGALLALPNHGTAQERRSSEEKKQSAEARRPALLNESKPVLLLEPLESRSDTVSFHIGSPLFLRLRVPPGNSACTPFNGTPFYFDANGNQLGWKIQEVTDTLLFPPTSSDCERILMLSSESSNHLPEGLFQMNVAILFDAKKRLTSNTIVLHPAHSRQGADSLSYTRFLQEQILSNNPLLHDPETLKALFAEGVPKSAESEVFRSVILFRAGDLSGAESALRASEELATRRGSSLNPAAAATREALRAKMAAGTPIR